MSNCSNIFCFNRCWNRGKLSSGHTRLEDLPKVNLDASRIGQDVVLVKSGRRICGSGCGLANAPIAQNKAYYEIKLQSTGVWGVGLATRKVDLNKAPLGRDAESWVLRNDGSMYHNNEEKSKLTQQIEEGDVLGITYDHVELNFFLNGQALSTPFTGMKGTVFPVFYVDDGAILDVQFTGFYHTPPDGYEEIMIEKSLL